MTYNTFYKITKHRTRGLAGHDLSILYTLRWAHLISGFCPLSERPNRFLMGQTCADLDEKLMAIHSMKKLVRSFTERFLVQQQQRTCCFSISANKLRYKFITINYLMLIWHCFQNMFLHWRWWLTIILPDFKDALESS